MPDICDSSYAGSVFASLMIAGLVPTSYVGMGNGGTGCFGGVNPGITNGAPVKPSDIPQTLQQLFCSCFALGQGLEQLTAHRGWRITISVWHLL